MLAYCKQHINCFTFTSSFQQQWWHLQSVRCNWIDVFLVKLSPQQVAVFLSDAAVSKACVSQIPSASLSFAAMLICRSCFRIPQIFSEFYLKYKMYTPLCQFSQCTCSMHRAKVIIPFPGKSYILCSCTLEGGRAALRKHLFPMLEQKPFCRSVVKGNAPTAVQ